MPLAAQRYEQSLGAPPLSEQLRIRDLLDNVAVQVDGSLVAGYEVGGIQSYYASDEWRNRMKALLEALVRSLPERSMRMQVRFEIAEGIGDLLSSYIRERRNENPVLRELDHLRVELWRNREATGFYLQHFLHLYLIWNPRIHHESSGLEWKRKMKSSGSSSLSAKKCVDRSRREHEELLREFNSLLAGVEATLGVTGTSLRRMSHQEIFLEIKRALHPLGNDTVPYRPTEESLWQESARSQMANVNIEDEQDEYLKVGGLLYSWISLKDLPDATFPGILRELVVMDCPLVINAEVTLPDQSRSIRQYKSRLRKMLAAQKDFHGGFRINVDAQVAEHQLVKVLQDLISSSLKACQMSLILTTRTSQPSRNRVEREEGERILSDRRQRLLNAIARMNGARGIAETLAQKRLFFTGLPAMGGENRRELDLLTLNAADLLPVEMPWRGTRHSPLMLFETPYRQLVSFSPFDSSLGDANMLIMAKSGGGKTFMAQLFLLMMARANPQISIIERGDSYQPLVDLMGGRVIDVKLDGAETLNPWDLPMGESIPSKEKIVFLKNLTRHMIGDSPGSDHSLVDNLLSDAIGRTYKRCAIRYSNPIPTFNDLREELAQWRDEERMQRTIDEARLAAIKLRAWTGEKGIYAKANRPLLSVVLDEFAPFGYRNFPQILQTARGTNTAFLFSMQSLPQLMHVGRGFKEDVASAPNTTMALRTRDEETARYFLRASAEHQVTRRSLSMERWKFFGYERYEETGRAVDVQATETRALDEHIKNLPKGQMEILMTDDTRGTLHSHLHVRPPAHVRVPHFGPALYPRLKQSRMSSVGANLRFKSTELAESRGARRVH